MGAKKFNEYEYKNNNQRIRVRFLRNSEERLNPWEITNFVSRVSTYMYKIEIPGMFYPVCISTKWKPKRIPL